MGTNYYVNIGEESLHIGKLSYGQRFLFRAHPKKDIFTVAQWQFFMSPPSWMENPQQPTRIVDEYGRTCSYEDFWAMISSYSKRDASGVGDYEDSLGHPFCIREFC